MFKWSFSHTITFCAVFIVTLLAYGNDSSGQQPAPSPAEKVLSVIGEPTNLSAKAFAVFNIKTGEFLAAKNIETPMPIASVTKLVTAVTLIEKFDLTEVDKVTASDVAADGRAGKLEVGNEYVHQELIFPLLLESSNDSAAYFERVTEGALVAEMNNFAEGLGLEATSFKDASGLSDGNISSVNDLKQILLYTYNEERHVLDITGLKQYVGTYTGWVNNSPVIDEGYVGGKHGYTVAANRTLVSIFDEEVERSEVKLGYILLGSDNLAKDIKTLRGFVHNSAVLE